MFSFGRLVAEIQRQRHFRRFVRTVGDRECSIPTHMTFDEKTTLFDLSRRMSPDGAIVEVGSYLGASTCFLAAGVRERQGAVTCIDTFMNETMPDGNRDTYQEFVRNTARYASTIRVVRKRSDELDSAHDLPPRIALLFLDGDHSFDNVQRELTFFLPLLSPGGVVAMHDVKYFGDVQRAMAERIVSGDLRLVQMVQNLGVLVRC